MAFYWIQSAYNLSDMLSKHWDHPTVYPIILKSLITRGYPGEHLLKPTEKYMKIELTVKLAPCEICDEESTNQTWIQGIH